MAVSWRRERSTKVTYANQVPVSGCKNKVPESNQENGVPESNHENGVPESSQENGVPESNQENGVPERLGYCNSTRVPACAFEYLRELSSTCVSFFCMACMLTFRSFMVGLEMPAISQHSSISS